MWYYILIGITLILIWQEFFQKGKRLSKSVFKKYKKSKAEIVKVDKRQQFAKLNQERKFIKLLKKLHIITDKRKEDLKDSLEVLSIKDTDGYILTNIKESVKYLSLGLGLMAFKLLLLFILRVIFHDDGFGMLLNFLGLIGYILIGIALFRVLFLKNKTKLEANKIIEDVEKDYSALVEHLYYYYIDGVSSVSLSDIMSKLEGKLSNSMDNLIMSVIEDCKISEEFALRKMQERYKSSLKISDLAVKLSRCINGHPLAKTYLEGLHEEVIKEEDNIRTAKEKKKTENYVFIMIGVMVLVTGFQLVGIMIEMFMKN